MKRREMRKTVNHFLRSISNFPGENSSHGGGEGGGRHLNGAGREESGGTDVTRGRSGVRGGGELGLELLPFFFFFFCFEQIIKKL